MCHIPPPKGGLTETQHTQSSATKGWPRHSTPKVLLPRGDWDTLHPKFSYQRVTETLHTQSFATKRWQRHITPKVLLPKGDRDTHTQSSATKRWLRNSISKVLLPRGDWETAYRHVAPKALLPRGDRDMSHLKFCYKGWLSLFGLLITSLFVLLHSKLINRSHNMYLVYGHLI